MATIGLAGIPQDLATWAMWLESARPFLSHEAIRTLMVAFGIGLLVYPRLRYLWHRVRGAELWVVQESEVEEFRQKKDLGGMHDPAWRIGRRVRIKLIYLGQDPIHKLCAERRDADGAGLETIRLGEHHGLGSVTSIATVKPNDTCNLFVFPKGETGLHSVMLQWVTRDGTPRRAWATLSLKGAVATIAPTKLVGESVQESEAKRAAQQPLEPTAEKRGGSAAGR